MAAPSRHRLIMLALAVAATLGIHAPLWAQQPLSEDAYWQAIRPRIDMMVHTVSQSPQFLNGHVGTPGWAASVTAQNATIQSMVREIATTQPPPHLAQVHELIVVGAGYCWRAMGTFILAVEQGSQPFMDYGMGYLTTCQSYIANATQSQSAAVPVQPAASAATPMPPPTWTPIAGLVATSTPIVYAPAQAPTWTPVPGLAPTATPIVSSGGQPFVCTGGCATPPNPSCAIKGNVNSSGERIYHMPEGQYWERTDIKPEEGDRWFCTPQEAEAAGFRAAER